MSVQTGHFHSISMDANQPTYANSADLTAVIDHSIPGNRLVKRPNGKLEMIPIDPAYFIGENVLRPLITLCQRSFQMLKVVDSMLSPLLPMAEAKEAFLCENGVCHENEVPNSNLTKEAQDFFVEGLKARVDGRFSDALKSHLKSLELLKLIPGPQNPEKTVKVHTAAALALTDLKLHQDAIYHLQQAIEAGEKDNPSSFQLMQSYKLMGFDLMELKRPEEALESFKKALKITLLQSPDDKNQPPRDELEAEISKHMGLILMSLNRSGEALTRLERASELYRQLHAVGPDVEFALALEMTGACLQQLNRFQDASPFLLESLEIRKKLHGTQPNSDFALALALAGSNFARIGEYEKAYTHLNDALAMQRKLFGTDAHPAVTNTLEWLRKVSQMMVIKG